MQHDGSPSLLAVRRPHNLTADAQRREQHMADELVFYTNPRSRGRIARWMLEEVGQPYRTEVLDFATTMKSPAYLGLNPMGKVPALRHGEAVVTETAAICAYLADAFPQAGLAPPPESRLRAPYYRWLFFASGPVEAAVSNKALGVAVPPERESMMGYGNVDRVLTVLEEAVSRADYLAGDTFTAADVYAGSQIGFGLMFKTIAKRPAFEHYWQRISARPAYARARDLDDALIPKQHTAG
jgi:glutathione S-transferase